MLLIEKENQKVSGMHQWLKNKGFKYLAHTFLNAICIRNTTPDS